MHHSAVLQKLDGTAYLSSGEIEAVQQFLGSIRQMYAAL
jgi:hypothetical protein